MRSLIFLVGGLIGWIIGYFQWQNKRQAPSTSEQFLRKDLANAEAQIRDLKSQLAQYDQQKEQLKTCEGQLQTKTEEMQRLTAQLAEAEEQLETLRKQLAAKEKKARAVKKKPVPKPPKEEAPSEEPVPEPPKEEAPSEEPDNLRRIQGIGPKLVKILNEAGIQTFQQLAETEVSRLKEILQGAGSSFKGMDPRSWPEQAGLAAKGDWEELKNLQSKLEGGRYK